VKLKRNPDYATDEQLAGPSLEARKLWRKASDRQAKISDALLIVFEPTRERMHRVLDARLDEIDRMRARARALDPKVESRLCLASGSINF
jgi:hypothetical protein